MNFVKKHTLFPGLALKQLGIAPQVSHPLFTNLEMPELEQPYWTPTLAM